MIVEDEALVALELESYLNDMGYHITKRVNSGNDAVTKAFENPPDLILMDINLNGEIDGIEAAKQIRTRLDIPIVFVTAYAEEEKLERAKLALPYGYLLKPIQERELKTTISMAFYAHQVDAERKKAEKERRDMEQKLFQAHKMESLGTLAGGIAHDFNNILQPIMVYADMINRKVPSDSKISLYASRIMIASERACKLVEQILTFSRQTDPDFRPVDLQSIIQEVIGFIRASISPTLIVSFKTSGYSGKIMGDVTQIHQILMNLVINAFHAIPDGIGQLDIELANLNIDHDYGKADELSPGIPPGTYARVSITDTGEGMEPEIMDRIFDPYFTTKEKEKGTGLGLSVVKGIVESHRGAISVSSQPGVGSRFEVLFPILSNNTSACIYSSNDSIQQENGDVNRL